MKTVTPAQAALSPRLRIRNAGHGLQQLFVDVFGVEPGFAGGAGQGQDEQHTGREVPAWRDDPPDHRDPVAYRGDLGQLLVVGLAQHPLLERVQPFVQPDDKRGDWV